MATSQRRSALVASVAQALAFAIDDPAGHNSWAPSHHRNSSGKRRRFNDTQDSATVFDSSAIPPIGIDKYLMRLYTHFKCSDACFIAALIMVDRLLEYDGGRLPLTMRNVHRVFLASLVVAVKYHEDLVYSNSHYAKAGGVHLREVNRLERVLLAAFDFDLRITPEEYHKYEAALLALCDDSPQKEGAPISEGKFCQPQATQGAITPSTCATSLPTSLANTPAASRNPSVTASTSAGEGSPETTPPGALSRAASALAPAATLRSRGVLVSQANVVCSGGYTGQAPCHKQGLETQFCAPWVVPPDRAIIEFDMAVHGSQ